MKEKGWLWPGCFDDISYIIMIVNALCGWLEKGSSGLVFTHHYLLWPGFADDISYILMIVKILYVWPEMNKVG